MRRRWLRLDRRRGIGAPWRLVALTCSVPAVFACAEEPPPPEPGVWELTVYDEGAATVDTLSGGVLDVHDINSPYRTIWHVQLRRPGFGLVGGETYVIRFRARSNFPRRIDYGVMMSHPPHGDLGVYTTAELVPVWRTFESPFIAKATDPQAEILFNLGQDTAGLSIADVAVVRAADGTRLFPPDPPTGP